MTQRPGLYWSIKRSFVLYVARMTDGAILGGPGLRMEDASTFAWSPAPIGDGALAFTGDVVFRAHEGALSFSVAEPHVHLGPERAELSIAGEARRLTMVTFDATQLLEDSGSRTIHGTDVRLTEEALPLFAGYYGAGEQFDDLRIVLDPDR